MRFLTLMLMLAMTGCAARKPAAAHLVAPPQCVKVKSPLLLDSQGRIVKKQKVQFETSCSEVRP